MCSPTWIVYSRRLVISNKFVFEEVRVSSNRLLLEQVDLDLGKKQQILPTLLSQHLASALEMYLFITRVST